MLPSGTHERYAFARPRVTEEERNRAIGTANTIAANPLNRIPSFMKKPRRETVVSVDEAITGLLDISHLLVLRVIRRGIWLPWVLNAAGPGPRNHVRDLLVRHWLSRNVAAPVRRTQFRPSCDDDR